MIKEINFSRKAVERINQLISKKPQGTFFRIAVKGGGCSGFKYSFSFDSSKKDDDILFHKAIIDKTSLNIINGSVIDLPYLLSLTNPLKATVEPTGYKLC